jgi:hypothetical protein
MTTKVFRPDPPARQNSGKQLNARRMQEKGKNLGFDENIRPQALSSIDAPTSLFLNQN